MVNHPNRSRIRHTKAEITMTWGPSSSRREFWHNLTIPAGTRCKPTGDGEYFVDDLTWLGRESLAYFDADHYGIRLKAEQVE